MLVKIIQILSQTKASLLRMKIIGKMIMNIEKGREMKFNHNGFKLGHSLSIVTGKRVLTNAFRKGKEVVVLSPYHDEHKNKFTPLFEPGIDERFEKNLSPFAHAK